MESFKQLVASFQQNSEASRFRKNFLSILKANMLARALPLLMAPVITRLFTPQDFGVYTIFLSIVAFLPAVSILRVDWSVPNTANQQRATELTVSGLLILLASVILMYSLLSTGIFEKIQSETVQSLLPYKWFLPLAVAGMAIQQLFQAWYIREATLKPVSRSKIMQSVVNVSGQVALGIANLGVAGLIISSIISFWVAVLSLSSAIREIFKRGKKLSLKKLSVTFGHFRNESFLSTLVSTVNASSLTALPLVMVFFYRPEELGWYGLMHRLAVVPMGLFTSAISQSFWAEAAKLIKSDAITLRRLYLKTTKKLLLVSLPLILLWLAAPFYVGPVFGSEWQPAAFILMALVPLLASQLVVSPLSHLIIHRKQHWQLVWDICRCICIVSTVIIMGTMGYAFVMTILFVSLIHLIFYVLLLAMNVMAFRT